MKFRVTVLCDNSVGSISGTLGEHGFAALVEAENGGRFLFDTGQGLTLRHNAARMNKKLAGLDAVVLSHGHPDHAGGLMALLEAEGGVQIYGHPGMFGNHFCRENGKVGYIGLPFSRQEYEAAGASFSLESGFRKIAEGVWLSGEIPRRTDFEEGDLELFCDRDGVVIDPMLDDQALLLEGERGLTVLLGCCHAGLINTLDHLENITGRKDFYAVIGGTHLGFCSESQRQRTVRELKKRSIRRIAGCHCTGFKASARLYAEMPKQYRAAMVGYALEI